MHRHINNLAIVYVPVIAAVAKQMKKHIKDKSKAAAKRKESKMELVAV